MKSTNMNTIKATYGLGEVLPSSVVDVLKERLQTEETAAENKNEDLVADLRASIKKFSGESANTIGQCAWPAFQCGPAFCTSFSSIFSRAIQEALDTKGDQMPPNVLANMKKTLHELKTVGASQSMMCLVPMAIDQAPYFRMARDAAAVLKCPKPAVIHSEFLPGLKQTHGKMSTTDEDSINSTVFLDAKPSDAEKHIKRHAFSGGKETFKQHELYGGDIRIDIPYQYLAFFLDSDPDYKIVAERYTSGKMSSGEIKALTAKLVAAEIERHQLAKAAISQDMIREFFDPNRTLDIGGRYGHSENELANDQYTDYCTYGINFDRTFGMKCKDM